MSSFLEALIGKLHKEPEVVEFEGKKRILVLIWSQKDELVVTCHVELFNCEGDGSAQYDLQDPQSIELDPAGEIINDLTIIGEPNARFYWGMNRMGKQYRSTMRVAEQDDGTWLVEEYLLMTPPDAAQDQHDN